jgi:PAS domain S-box-containing protein
LIAARSPHRDHPVCIYFVEGPPVLNQTRRAAFLFRPLLICDGQIEDFMDKPRLSVVETQAAAVEQKVVRAWTEFEPYAGAGGRGRGFETLRERERRFHELLEALPTAIYTTDENGKITYYNQAAVDLWGCSPVLGSTEWCGSWKLFWPNGLPMRHDQCPMAMALREKRPIRGMEAIAERADGIRVPFIPFPTPLYDSAGALVGAVNMLVDITDRKRAENQQALMIRELHHRVRNTLATVQAVMRTTARASATIEEFEEAFVGRIDSLSKTHELLTENFDQAVALATLLSNELDAYDDGACQRVRLKGPPVELPSVLAVPIGMALHELTTNAAKYGSLSMIGGVVEVTWSVRIESGARRLHVEWIEQDGPAVKPPTRKGFGSRLLEHVLARQIGADVTVDYDPDGLRARIIVPLPR